MAGELTVGFARRDITPHERFPNGTWMTQRHARANGIHRRLNVNCLIAGDATDAVALLSYDMMILSIRQVDAIKAAIGKRTGLSADRVWLYVTHNHAGPVTQDFYDREGADEVRAYIQEFIDKSADAAEEAWGSRRPARAASATGRCTIGINRDLPYNGRIITGPNFEGFTDPGVGVLRVDDLEGRPLAAIVTYGCHPTYLGPDNTLVSPDYPGVARDIFEQLTGAPCMFLQAGAGNVGPLRGFLGVLEEVERDGTILGAEAAKTFLMTDTRHRRWRIESVVESAAPLGVVTGESTAPSTHGFDFVSCAAPLLTDNPGPTVFDDVEADLARADDEVRSLQEANASDKEIQQAIQRRLRYEFRLERKRTYFSQKHFDVGIRALRLGSACFISVACEAYAEIGASIKADSPFPETIFAAYEGPDVLYVAPRKSFSPPLPMEVVNSPFGPAAGDTLVHESVAALRRLKARQGA
jgi:hypothetical protein